MKKGNSNNCKKKGLFFRFLSRIVSLFYKKCQIIDEQNIPTEPCIFIGNHAKIHGPLNGQLYFPKNKLIWCDGPMMVRKEFPEYAYNNFWGGKPNVLCKMFANILAPLITYVFRNADALPVYRDMRIMKTYKASTDALEKGVNVVIFPECPDLYNEITNQFNEYFVDTARFYYKHTGKEVLFTPFYYSKYLKKMVFGKPIRYDSNVAIEEQRKSISKYLMEEITTLAKSLPAHKVIPFNNVPKKEYKNSK